VFIDEVDFELVIDPAVVAAFFFCIFSSKAARGLITNVGMFDSNV
jgi:hypothetical protein